MDIRKDEQERSVRDLFPLWGIGLIVLSIVFSIGMAFIIDLRAGIISSVSILVAVGVITTDSWNKELKEDGYASLSQLYSSYLAVVFLFIALFPTLSGMLGIIGGVGAGLMMSLSYIVVLNSVAFRDITEHETAVSAYEGPSVVYLPSGPYFDHIEQIAQDKKDEPEE